MVLMSRRQAEVLEELEEWREDVRERGIGSRVVLLAVPKGWGVRRSWPGSETWPVTRTGW